MHDIAFEAGCTGSIFDMMQPLRCDGVHSLRIKRLERRKFITHKIGFLKSLHYSSNRCPPTRYSILFALSLCFILMKLFHELVVHVRIEFR